MVNDGCFMYSPLKSSSEWGLIENVGDVDENKDIVDPTKVKWQRKLGEE